MVTISKQLSTKHSGQRLMQTFLKSHFTLIAVCPLGNFFIIVWGCSWYSFVVTVIFILCIDLFQQINLRSSLPGDVLEISLSLYSGRTFPPERLKIFTNCKLRKMFFSTNVFKFCQSRLLNSFNPQPFSS